MRPSALDPRARRPGPGAAETGVVAGEGIAVPYRVVRSARRRRTLELRVEADGIRVAVPLRTSRAEVEAFVRSRLPWIRRQRGRTSARPPVRLAEGATVPYLGRPLPVVCTPASRRRAAVTADLLGLAVALPRHEEQERPALVEDALRRWLRARANEEIPGRVTAWAARAGYGPSRVLVRDQKRRWGSCAKDGTLRFNWRLVMLEPRLIDYVVAHEVAHLRHAHHRPAFWAEVERLMPDYCERRRALGEAGARLPI